TALTSARLALAKAKVKTTMEFLDGVVEQGEKVVVFSAFDEPVQRIARHFGDAAVVLTGKTPSRSRQKLVDRFQTDPNVRVFVANIVAGGVGINLTAARQVVFNDLDWVPANHFQAEDRAYRIGQAGTVNVTYMVAPGTVDDFVRTSLEAKAALIDAVVEGSGDIPLGSGLLEELQDALRSLSPEIATLSDDESGEDPVDRVLREVTAAVERKEAAERAAAGGAASAAPKRPSLSSEAIRALARALAGPRSERFRVTGSRGGRYELDVVDGG